MKKIVCLFFGILFTISFVFSQGYYMEFKISTDKGVGNGTMKIYSQDGNSRSEVAFDAGDKAAALMGGTIVSLTLKDAPDKVYMLNPEKKLYNEMDVSKRPDTKDKTAEDYEVTIIGKEAVNGYASTHVKVKVKGTGMEEELWVSTDINGYTDLLKVKSKYTGREGLNKALSAKGAEGVPVRIRVSQQGGTAQIDLLKAEKRSNAASLFSLDGYTKSEGSVGTPGNMKEMMQKIQNMTPEERKKFIEEMKQQQHQK
jgi:hypothetical protein